MLSRIEDFFFNKLAGKLAARAAVTAAAYLTGPKAMALLGSVGVSVSVDPATLEAGAIAAAHAVYEMFKAWRSGAPRA